MNAQELINIITPSDILTLMNDLGADLVKETNEYFIFTSICHESDSHKLYYYFTKRFYCYSNCGSMDIYELIMKVKDCDFKTAFNYLRSIVNGYNRPIIGFGGRQFKNVDLDEIVIPKIEPIKKQFLYNIFKKKEIKEWSDEGISYETQQKFNIRYDERNNRAIIPVFQDDKCIGIRTRCFNPIDILKGKKYIPLFYDDVCYNFKTSDIFYGLNITKNSIKKYNKIIITEGEKSVLKGDVYWGDMNCTVAMFGSNLSKVHKKIIIELANGNNNFEVVMAMDKEYVDYNSQERIDYENKIIKNLEGLTNYVKCSYVIDKDNLLDLKMSPFDNGYDVLKILLNDRIKIN